MKREPLYGKNLTELQGVCAELQLPRFVAKQIADWLYKKGVRSFEEMTNLSKAARTELSEKYEVGLHAPERVDSSADGTKKYLYRTAQDHFVESAYIPDRERATLCVSSQAGCRMGCRFCATARLGLKHSLSSCDILNQIASLPERESLTNVVFMGMGEPLDNIENVLRALEIMTSEWGFGWSPTRITLSTAGVAKELRHFSTRHRYISPCRSTIHSTRSASRLCLSSEPIRYAKWLIFCANTTLRINAEYRSSIS